MHSRSITLFVIRIVALSVTVGTATSDLGAVVLGVYSRVLPASDNDQASVDEIVT